MRIDSFLSSIVPGLGAVVPVYALLRLAECRAIFFILVLLIVATATGGILNNRGIGG